MTVDPTVDSGPVITDTTTTDSPNKPEWANVYTSADEQKRMYALDVAGRLQHNGIDSYLQAADKVLKYITEGNSLDQSQV